MWIFLVFLIALPSPLVGQVELTEVVRIGSVTGGAMDSFGKIVDVAMDPEAQRIYVLDGQASTVTVWSLEGDFLFEFGGSGSGPGEFDGPPNAIALGPDQALVAGPSRIHLFSRDGELRWTRRIETLSHISVTVDVHVSSEAVRFLARESEPGQGQYVRAYHLDVDGSGAWAHEGEWQFVTGSGVPLGSRRHWAMVDGAWLLNVPDEYALVRANGTDRMAVRHTPELLANDVVRALVDELRRECEASSMPGVCADGLQDPIAELEGRSGTAIPPIGEIETWSTGEVLVARSDLAPTPFERRTARFDIVRLGGGIEEKLVLPEPITLSWAGEGWVVGVVQDEFDVDHVVVYRVP